MELEEKINSLKEKYQTFKREEQSNQSELDYYQNLSKQQVEKQNEFKLKEEKNTIKISELNKTICYLETKVEKFEMLEKDVCKWRNSYEETKIKVNELVTMSKQESYKYYESQCKTLTGDYEKIISECHKQVQTFKDSKQEAIAENEK